MKLSIKEKIKVLLKRKEATQRDLAVALGIVEKSLINKMGEDTDWTLGELKSMADFFGITITELVE